MIYSRRMFTTLALAGSVAFVTNAFAKHNHNSGQQLLGGKLNTNGTVSYTHLTLPTNREV